MNKIKVGDRLKIHCYKHNGKLHRTWDEATVLDYNNDWLVCGNNRTTVTESDGRSYKTKEPAILFFYKNHWFNVIAQLKSHGLYYYCNIASPYLVDEFIIKYIDYDLDLRVFPDDGYRILDKNEYKYHKKLMKYSNDLDIIIKNELNYLINLKINSSGPFNKKNVDKYYNLYKSYLKIQKN